MLFRIALIGASELMRTRLAEILRGDEFVIDIYDPNIVASIFDYRLHSYDLIIASSDLVTGLKEDTVFTSLLAARGFLLFEEKPRQLEVEPSFLIHSGMSPEDILAKINNILYLNAHVRKSPRIKVNQPIEYDYEGKRYQSTTQYLGENGVFISTLAPPKNGTHITVRFSLPGGNHDIVASGRIVYSVGANLDQSIISHPAAHDRKIVSLPGVGVVFDQISDSDRDAIRDFLAKHL